MDIEHNRPFWEGRWASGQIGFHRLEPNSLLRDHISFYEGRKRVYVPLCGKSLDLVYLREQGHEVIGSEFVPLAIEQFFQELGEKPKVVKRGDLRVHSVDGISIVEGDAFQMDATHFGGAADAVFDRGSLVAIDPRSRNKFADAFLRVLAPQGRIGSVVFEYDQSKIDGPPWSVGHNDMEALFGDRGSVRLLGERPEAVSTRLAEAGVQDVAERMYGVELF